MKFSAAGVTYCLGAAAGVAILGGWNFVEGDTLHAIIQMAAVPVFLVLAFLFYRLWRSWQKFEEAAAAPPRPYTAYYPPLPPASHTVSGAAGAYITSSFALALLRPEPLLPEVEIEGPLYGWRTYRIDRIDRTVPTCLYGMRRAWPKASMVAKCSVGHDIELHLIGSEEYDREQALEHLVKGVCQCGIYVRKGEPYGLGPRDAVAYCEIEGAVVEHEHGWRAEKVTIRKLYVYVPPGEPREPLAVEMLDMIKRMGGGIELHLIGSEEEWKEATT